MAAITQARLAKLCGYSSATVSRALAGSLVVRTALRNRIALLADKHGYQRNPMVGAVMSQVRRATFAKYAGNLAVVYIQTEGERNPHPFHRAMIVGAQTRARELGFSFDEFQIGGMGLTTVALDRILRARGITGLLFLHSRKTAELPSFEWSRYSVAEIDYCLGVPKMHTILLDHHVTLVRALAELKSRGYKRVGVFIERFKDERLMFKWRGAFRAFQEGYGGIGRVPVLCEIALNRSRFQNWVKKHEPDLVVGHADRVLPWLTELGLRVPHDLGFLNLNWNERTQPCAGLDLCPTEQGAVATETIIAQIQRNESGFPSQPRTTMVIGRLIEGATVHPPSVL